MTQHPETTQSREAGSASVVADHRSSSASNSLERGFLQRLVEGLGNPPLKLVLWDGSEIAPPGTSPQATARIGDRRTLWGLIWDPHLRFGESYADGRITVDGDLLQFLRTFYSSLVGRGIRIRQRWHLKRSNTLAGSQRNIHQHYDIGNEFYKLWLDDHMLYTCAYYRDREMTLDQAQVAKMDHVCRKLQLKPNETVIEAGCGWGGFALHMAREYGVTVRAFNISKEQVAYAREAAEREGLADRVEFIEDDWRNIAGKCDVFVSVGMLEHVGVEHYPLLGRLMDQCLESTGRGLIHTIGRNFPGRLNPWIEQYIFPGAQPPALSEMTQIFESQNFSVLDIENIRLHYAQTCRHWLERFEDRLDDLRDTFDERFIRMWRLYLAASAAAFEFGSLQLFQVLFAPGRSNNVPWNREYQYAHLAAYQCAPRTDVGGAP